MNVSVVGKRAARAPIRLYQMFRAGRPSQCRYVPSCSVYALEAVQMRGIVIGSLLATKRILSCNPFGGRGYDPVPATGFKRGIHS